MNDRKYTVVFRIEVDASSRMEALEVAREGVELDYADVLIDGKPA